MASFTMYTIVGVLLLLSTPSLAQVPPSECLANAVARADPRNAVADAISNAVAQSFGKVISCRDGVSVDTGSTSSLAISVAVAIAESREAGAQCTATADATAEEVGNQVAGWAEQGLVDGSPTPTGRRLAEAWMERERPEIARKVYEGELENMEPATDSAGCIDVLSILGTTPTAASIGDALNAAVTEILTAVTCGSNVVNVPGESCNYDGVSFVGECMDDMPPAKSAKKKPTAGRKMT